MNELLASQQLIQEVLDKAAQIQRQSSSIARRLCSIGINEAVHQADATADTSATHLHVLPPDALSAVTGHLQSVGDVCRLMQVCKRLHSHLSYDDGMWQHLCMLDYGLLPATSSASSSAGDQDATRQTASKTNDVTAAGPAYLSMHQSWRQVQQTLQWLQEHHHPIGVSGRAHRQQLLTALQHLVSFTNSTASSSNFGSNGSTSSGRACRTWAANSKVLCAACGCVQTSAAGSTTTESGQMKIIQRLLGLGTVASLAALLQWQDQLHVHELASQVLANLLQASTAACQEMLAGGYTNALRPLLTSHSETVVHHASRALSAAWRFNLYQTTRHMQKPQGTVADPQHGMVLKQNGNQQQQDGVVQPGNSWQHRQAAGSNKLGTCSSCRTQVWVLTECWSSGEISRQWRLEVADSNGSSMDIATLSNAGAAWTAQCTPADTKQTYAVGAADDLGQMPDSNAVQEAYQLLATTDDSGPVSPWQFWLLNSAAAHPHPTDSFTSSLGSNAAGVRPCIVARPESSQEKMTDTMWSSRASALHTKFRCSSATPANDTAHHLVDTGISIKHAIFCYQGWWDEKSECISGVYGSAGAFLTKGAAGWDLGKAGCGLRVSGLPGKALGRHPEGCIFLRSD